MSVGVRWARGLSVRGCSEDVFVCGDGVQYVYVLYVRGSCVRCKSMCCM